MAFWLDAKEVEALMDSPDASKVEIVDCRDDDRDEGWILGSTNFPSREQNAETMAAFVEAAASRGRDLLVFHCMYSQVRGPRAANLAVSALQRRGMVTMRVAVLRGGWISFSTTVGRARPQLCQYP
jgi:hypothetical protein